MNKYTHSAIGLGSAMIVVQCITNQWNRWLGVLIWGIILVVIVNKVPRIHGLGKIKYNKKVYCWAFNTAVAWSVVYIGLGFVEGFGKSPYDHSLRGIVINTILVGVPLVGREVIRSYLIRVFARRKGKGKSLLIIIILMTLLEIRVERLCEMEGLQDCTIFFASQLLPVLSKNILATFLSLYGGAQASLIYLGMQEAYEWLMPILPHLGWLAQGMVGMIIPCWAAHVISRKYSLLSGKIRNREGTEKVGVTAVWAGLSVMFIWFVVGLFPIYPTVIVTGSMEPIIKPGDVVIVRKLQDEEALKQLQVGDIIQFRKERIWVNHRIVAIEEEEQTGMTYYKTKGDNNTSEDVEGVKVECIRGIVKWVIPKIGLPTLILKGRSTIPEGVVF